MSDMNTFETLAPVVTKIFAKIAFLGRITGCITEFYDALKSDDPLKRELNCVITSDPEALVTIMCMHDCFRRHGLRKYASHPSYVIKDHYGHSLWVMEMFSVQKTDEDRMRCLIWCITANETLPFSDASDLVRYYVSLWKMVAKKDLTITKYLNRCTKKITLIDSRENPTVYSLFHIALELCDTNAKEVFSSYKLKIDDPCARYYSTNIDTWQGSIGQFVESGWHPKFSSNFSKVWQVGTDVYE
jgi:hypothetical protein